MDQWKLLKDYWRFAVGGAVLMVLLIIWFVPFSQNKETNWQSMADAAGQSSEMEEGGTLQEDGLHDEEYEIVRNSHKLSTGVARPTDGDRPS